MRPMTPQQTEGEGGARGARLRSEATLLRAASCPSSLARPSGPRSVAGQMFVGLVRPLL